MHTYMTIPDMWTYIIIQNGNLRFLAEKTKNNNSTNKTHTGIAKGHAHISILQDNQKKRLPSVLTFSGHELLQQIGNSIFAPAEFGFF